MNSTVRGETIIADTYSATRPEAEGVGRALPAVNSRAIQLTLEHFLRRGGARNARRRKRNLISGSEGVKRSNPFAEVAYVLSAGGRTSVVTRNRRQRSFLNRNISARRSRRLYCYGHGDL
ncbi:hypothetical protein EVAR_8265_1 [Eumeta japonica]|uniref:Uncharacterized protein n=1 Tax=Eumeta variegata TaxID=151549 RepID=A0A4C1TGV3_EUMVA|nr:hypothetical protein EVAR_8265_1 [Eumeta japonica]